MIARLWRSGIGQIITFPIMLPIYVFGLINGLFRNWLRVMEDSFLFICYIIGFVWPLALIGIGFYQLAVFKGWLA